MADLEGLIVATPTPFDDRGGIDFDYVVRHFDFLHERGVDGVVPSGTNGEGASLSISERKELFRVAIANRGNMSVISGTGCASLPETVELTQTAERLGADAVLVIPPFYFKDPSVDGLTAYYSEVLRSSSLPILLYNIPQFSAVEISDELVERLSGFPNLLGIKDSSGRLDRAERYRERFPSLNIYVGDDRLIERTAGLGVSGVVSGLANAFPELIRDTMSSCTEGRGGEMQRRVDRLADVFSRYPLFASNKYALTLRGLPYSHVRPPLTDLTEEQKASLEAELRREGLIR